MKFHPPRTSLPVAMALVGLLAPAGQASAAPIMDYAIFGHAGFSAGNTFTAGGAPIGSNGDVTLGNMNTSAAGTNHVGYTGVGGNLTTGSRFTSTGDVDVNGNAVFGSFASVAGTAAAGGTLTPGGLSSFAGGATGNVLPPPFTPVPIPAASDFVTGPTSVSALAFGGIANIAPGAYNNLTAGFQSTVNLLEPGEYTFAAVTLGNTVTVNFLGDGPFSIFVAGDFTAGNTNVFNGTAQDIFLEAGGNIAFGNTSPFNGTLFAPHGDITVGSTFALTGAAWAGGEINFADRHGVHVDFVIANNLPPQIPEPASATALLLGMAAIVFTRRRKAS